MALLTNINGKFVVEQTTGYVGVGTTDPSYLLHMSSADISNGTRLIIENTNASGKEYGLIADNTGVFSIRDLSASADRLSISSGGDATFAGNVGIGTSSFGHFSTAKHLLVEGDSVNTNSIVQVISYDNNSSLAIYSGESSTDNPAIIYQNDLRFGSATNIGLGGYTERMRITSAGTIKMTDENGGVPILQVRNFSTAATGAFTDAYAMEFRGATTTGSTGGMMLLHMNEANDTRPTLNVSDSNGIFATFTNGKVGIGKPVPVYQLDVLGTGSYGGMIQMENTTANAYPRLAIQSDVKGYHIGVGGSGAGAGYANNLYFYDNNEAAVRMVIDTNGNVGIGTTSPSAKLHVKNRSDELDMVVKLEATRDSYLQFSPANTTKWALIADYPATGDFTTYNYPNNFNSIIFKDNKDITTNLSGGNFGIGTTLPTAKLEVQGDATAVALWVQTGGTTSSYTIADFRTGSNLSALAIKGDGNSTFGGAIIGNSGGTTEIGAYPTGGIKRIMMGAGGEIHFGDTTTLSPLGLTEGTWNQFTDTDRLGLYMRNELKIYGNSSLLKVTIPTSGNITFAEGAIFGGNLYIAKTTPQLILEGRGSGNSGAAVQFLGWAASNVNWQLGNAIAGSGFQIRSSAVGGATFTTVAVIDGSSGVYTPTSDVNKKKDFEDSEIGLKEVMELQPKLFRMKTESEDTDKHLGFIAQEVKEVIPQAYVEQGEDDEKFIGLNEMPIIAALTKAIQELKAEIEILKNK